MQIKDQETMSLLEGLADHINNNVRNRYLRPAMQTMNISDREWALIDSVSEKSEYYRLQGYHFDELYERLHALAHFVRSADENLRPRLRQILHGSAGSAQDRVVRDMTINNFPANLDILRDSLIRVFRHVARIDEESHPGQPPAYRRSGIREDLKLLLGVDAEALEP